MTALLLPPVRRPTTDLRPRDPSRLLSALLLAATFALPASAQNWVGFGDEAWPAGNALYDRAGIPANVAGEAMVRLDGWEHGGWGATAPATRTIHGVKFFVRNTSNVVRPLPIKIYPENPALALSHEPDLGYTGPTLLATPNIPALFTGQFTVNLGLGSLASPCQNNGDFFVSFGLAAGDGLSIGYVNSLGPTADVPGPAYGTFLASRGTYPAPVKASHRLRVVAGVVTYVGVASQYYIDVAQAPNLVSGVGGTVTTQLTYPASGVVPGTTDFLSGSNPWCGAGAVPGLRAPIPADGITMTARKSVAAPGSLAVFFLSGGMLSCALELWMWPPLSSGTICIDPSQIILSAVVPLTPVGAGGTATLNYGVIPPFACGIGITHQAFVIDAFDGSIHGGPCDHQDIL